MSSTPTAVRDAPALTLDPAQLKSQLWADPSQRVHAVMMGSRLPGLMERLHGELAANELEDFDCLLPGALTAAQQAEAPYLVRLRPATAFTDWLLFEASPTLGDWGVLASSALQMTALRSHLRALREARLPNGSTITLDWMDPAVMRLLLPLFDASALAGFMGPVSSWVIPGDGQWTLVRAPLGRLEQRELRYRRG
jgi:hypothetical protein